MGKKLFGGQQTNDNAALAQLADQNAAQAEALREKATLEKRAMERDRILRSNLYGSRSTQSTDVTGFTGYRRTTMGATQGQGKSIRT